MTGNCGPTAGVGAAALLIMLTLAVLVLPVGPAGAHASLQESTPADGAALDEPPAEVVLRFSEPVNAAPGAISVLDAAGASVDRGDVGTVDGGDDAQLRVGLRQDLAPGAYQVTYDVLSVDGHVIQGGLAFTVRRSAAPSPEPDPEPEQSADTSETQARAAPEASETVGAVAPGPAPSPTPAAPPVASGGIFVDVGLPLARAITYLGVLVAAGGVAFLLAVQEGGRNDRGRLRRVVVAACAVALVGSVAWIGAQASQLGGVTRPGAVQTALAGSAGTSAVLRVATLSVLVLLLARRPDASRTAAGASLLALGSFLIEGHTISPGPAAAERAVLLGADAVHLVAGAVWLGGLVCLAVVLQRREGSDPVWAVTVVARFSRLATWSVVAAAGAGFALSWSLVGTAGALLAGGYGAALLVKVALVSAVVAVAAYNRHRLLPAVVDATSSTCGHDAGTAADRAWGQLRRTVRAEVAGLVAVVAVTGVLVGLRPPTDAVTAGVAVGQAVPWGSPEPCPCPSRVTRGSSPDAGYRSPCGPCGSSL